MTFVVSQILAFIAIFISMVTSIIKIERRPLLICQIIVNVVYGVHNFLLGAVTGGVINLLAVVLITVYYFKGKSKWISGIWTPAIFAVLFVLSAVLSWVNIFSLLPTIASLLFAIAFWLDKEKQIKFVYLINTLLWLTYAIITGSIVAAIGQGLLGSSLLIYLIFGKKYEAVLDKINIWVKSKFFKPKDNQ